MGAAKASEQGQVRLGGGRFISGDPWRASREGGRGRDSLGGVWPHHISAR